jgi:signal peptidase I
MNRQTVVRELRAWIIILLSVGAFRAFAYEPVHIPSGSMIPTLEVGDYVLVEKWAYGARLPFTGAAQATWSSPKRGDVVVLLAPPGSSRDDDLIKRVVAVAGDRVALVDGALRVNGVRAPREAVPGPCRYADRGEDGAWTDDPCADFVEELDGHRYHSYCTPGFPCGDVEEVTVPAGMVWLAGDHRDHSADSRVFGPVPVGRIKGRAWLVAASWGPHGPRWNRLLQGLKR